MAGPSVLLLWDDDAGTTVPDGLNVNTKALIAAMEDAGLVVTLSAVTQGRYTGFNPSANDFDAIVHLNGGGTSSYIMGTAGVSRLVSYVRDSGGAYIGSENNSAQMAIPLSLGGLSSAMADLTLIDRIRGWGVAPITVTVIAGQEAHPLLAGVPAEFTFSSSRKQGNIRNYTQDPAIALMVGDDGSAAVAVREFGSGRVVSFHHGGNSSGANTLSDPNVQRLYINGVLWGDKKAPLVQSIVRIGPEAAGPGTLAFTVHFSEGVTGVDAGDFAVIATGTVRFANPPAINATSDREYVVTVTGVTGNGTLGLNLLDDDSIRDKSFNQNRLGGEGNANGDFAGEAYIIDGQRPRLSEFHSGESVWLVGTTPQFILVFNEPMDQTVTPVASIRTEDNGDIPASAAGEGGDGAWVDATHYSVSADRAVVAEDASLAVVVVSGARDLACNVMAQDASSTLFLVRESLHIVRRPSVFSWAELGDSHTFSVEVSGAQGDVHYQWYKEALGKAFLPVGPDDAQYALTDLEYSDSGTYYCVVSDSERSVQTTPAILSVVESLPVGGVFEVAMLMCLLALLGHRQGYGGRPGRHQGQSQRTVGERDRSRGDIPARHGRRQSEPADAKGNRRSR